MTPLPTIERECGPCTACCVIQCCEELQKPARHACKQLSKDSPGCSVYDTRPDVCRIYQCGWKVGLGSPEERPDKVGVMFSLTPQGKRNKLEVYELREGALKENFNLDAIRRFVEVLPESNSWDVTVYPFDIPECRETRFPVDAAYVQTAVYGENVMATMRLPTGGQLLVHIGCETTTGGDVYFKGKYIDRKYKDRYLRNPLFLRQMVHHLLRA